MRHYKTALDLLNPINTFRQEGGETCRNADGNIPVKVFLTSLKGFSGIDLFCNHKLIQILLLFAFSHLTCLFGSMNKSAEQMAEDYQ